MRVAHVVGTRPNFMKIAPLLSALGKYEGVRQSLIHTGQHYDRGLSDAFFEDLELPYPDYFLGVGSTTLAAQAARIMLGLEPVLGALQPDVVVVPGDVNSTMAAAVTAAQLEIALVHLEAGLRSRDRSMPEEHNRVIADHLADLLLTPSADAGANLIDEGIRPEQIAFVGNIMIDSLRRYLDVALELDIARRDYGVENYVLVTLHRPGLVDHPRRLVEVMEGLERIALDRPVLFPAHPRTRSRLLDAGWTPTRVRLLEPLGYVTFLSLEASADAIVTDSGGVQEEATVLGVPCFTMRANTERPITVTEGTNRVVGADPVAVDNIRECLSSLERRTPRTLQLWDGHAADRAAEAIVTRLGAASSRTNLRVATS